MYSAFDHWAYLSHMLTGISMFSPCTQWVFGPLSPVRRMVEVMKMKQIAVTGGDGSFDNQSPRVIWTPRQQSSHRSSPVQTNTCSGSQLKNPSAPTPPPVSSTTPLRNSTIQLLIIQSDLADNDALCPQISPDCSRMFIYRSCMTTCRIPNMYKHGLCAGSN